MKLMNAVKAKDVKDLIARLDAGEFMASPKIDGIRACVRDGVVLGRSGKPLPNKQVQELYGRDIYNGFDGELTDSAANHPQAMARAQSWVMSIGTMTDEPLFSVFDVNPFAHKAGYTRGLEFDADFQTRYTTLSGWFKKNYEGIYGMILLPSIGLTGVEHYKSVLAYHDVVGYEGTMLRLMNGIYKEGRASAKNPVLVKVKSFEDSEAIVTGVEELMHNANEAEIGELGQTKRSSKKDGMVPAGTLGALVCKTEAGIPFKIGVFKGITKNELQDWWNVRDTLLGKSVTYSHQPHGAKDAPRLPVFLHFREDL